MTYRLIIMRHAEAEDPSHGSDWERKLTSRGRKRARQVATAMERAGWIPFGAAVSDARRTRETADELRSVWGRASIVWTETAELYLSGLTAIKSAIKSLDKSGSTLLVLGHNPGFSEAVTILTGEYLPLRPADAVLLTLEDASSWMHALEMTRCWELRSLPLV